MKYLFAILFLILSNLPPAFAQAFDVIASDFSADGKVIELDVPDTLDGLRFAIFVYDGRMTSSNLTVARPGRHCYEMRHLPEWHGTVKMVAITHIGNIAGRLKEPTFADEVDMFLEPERVTAATINLLIQHKVAAWSWTMCLLALAVVCALVFRFREKKTFVKAGAFGFLVAWALMDLRIMFDHASIVYSQTKFHGGAFPLVPMETFADEVSATIGRQNWGRARMKGEEIFLDYRLAEHPYAAPGSGRAADFWFTEDPKEGEVVARRDQFYLVKRGKP